MDRLAAIEAFVETYRAGSFAKAGEKLRLAPSSVSRSVARLEARLGVRLFQRSTRALTATSEGVAFFGRCSRTLAELEEAEATMAGLGSTPRGRLRVDAPVIYGRKRIASRLTAFLDRFPDVTVDLGLNDRFVDLVQESIDVAVRIGGARDSALTGRKIDEHAQVLCASPAYLERAGVPRALSELDGHRCVAMVLHGRRREWLLRERGREVRRSPSGRLEVNDGEALREAALAGEGLVQVSDYTVEADLAEGRLVPVLAGHAPPAEPVLLVFPPVRKPSPKLRAFVDFFAQGPHARLSAASARSGGG